MSRFKIAAAAIALLPAAAYAQNPETAPARGDEDITLIEPRPEIIVTATGAVQRPDQTGQAIVVIDHALIETRQTQSIADLLSTTPGITISRNGGIGQPTAVRIRGAEGEQTLTLIDGVRVNDPSSPGGAFDFGNLLTGNIDRIEVLRGPNSVPWGSQAIGGVVNIVTSQFDGARLRGEYGYKNSAQVVGQAGGRFGPVAASIGGGYFDDDGISAFKGGTERDGYRQYAGNARVAVDFADNIALDLRAYYADSRVSFDGFPPPTFAFADTAEFSQTQQIFGYAGLKIALFDDALKNRIAFTIADTNRDSFNPAFGAAPSFRARGRTERYEYQGVATITDGIDTVFGIEHEDSRFTDGFAPASTRLDSGYLQAIVTPTRGLTLTGGVRVDDHKDYGTKATFSANAALALGSGTVLRASYGEGFKAPTLFQLLSDFGNRDLQPETARSYDLGIEQRALAGALRFGVTAFHRDTTNQIDFFSCFASAQPLCATRPFGFFDNIARTRAQGLEMFVEARPTERLTFAANYSLIDAKNRLTGNALLRRPLHSVNANVDWRLRDWLRLGASLQSVSDSRDTDFQTFSATSLDGYTLVGLRASIPIGNQLEVYGRIENLFNETYETVSGYGTLGRNAHIGVRLRL